jgi:transposase
VAIGELFILVTDRFDLKTYEIIMLYAYRWQVELIFRFLKRTLNALPLMCHEEVTQIRLPKKKALQMTMYVDSYHY